MEPYFWMEINRWELGKDSVSLALCTLTIEMIYGFDDIVTIPFLPLEINHFEYFRFYYCISAV